MVGPTQYCAGYGPGEGLDSCLEISKGCWASMPLGNMVPVTTCNGTIPDKTALEINGTIYPATRYGNGSLVPITTGSATFDKGLVPTSYSEPWYNTSSIDAGFNSIFPTNTSTLFPYSPLPTATSGLANYSSYVAACYSDWNWYYSWSAQNQPYNPDNFLQVNGTFLSTTTFISTWSEDMYAYTKDNTESITETYTTTEFANGFAISTSTTTQSETLTMSGLPASDVKSLYTSTVTSTTFSESWITVSPSTKFPTKPSCKLPPVVSNCQSTWNAYESMVFSSLSVVGAKFDCQQNWTNAECSSASSLWFNEEASYVTNPTLWTTPPCTQASVGSSLCNHIRSAYMQSWTAENSGFWDYPGQVINAGYITSFVDYSTTIAGKETFVEYESTYWPASSSMAPGCTLGCGACAITGGTVQLIYWPEGTMAQTAAPTLNSTLLSARNAPLSARQNPNSDIAVAFAFNTTFTSPTVYIRYGSLYASDSCSDLGKTYSNTYITLPNSNDLSSIWATYPFPIAHTASFNYTDLNTPVPLSIYDRQPRCAEYTADTDPYTEIANFSCPHDRPYEPILFVPSDILRSVDPSWATCSGDVRGQYDPPYKLSKYSVAADPDVTPSANAMPQPASPGSPINSVTALQTSPPTPAPVDPDTSSKAAASTPSHLPAPVAPHTGGAGGIIGSILNPSSLQSDPADPGDPSSTSGGRVFGPASGIISIIAGSHTSEPASVPAFSADPAAGDPSDPGAGGAQSSIAQASPAAPAPAPVPAPASVAADPDHSAQGLPASTIVGGNTIAGDPSSSGDVVVVNGQTIAPGQVNTVNGQSVSNDGSGTVVVGAGPAATSVAVPAAVPTESNPTDAPSQAQPITVIGGNPISAASIGSGAVVVAGSDGSGQTLGPGQGTVVANTPLSVNSAGSLVVGSGPRASTIDVAPDPSLGVTSPAVATVGGQPVSAAEGGSGIILGSGQTLQPGQGTTIANTPVSVNPAGSLVVGSGPAASTLNIPPASAFAGLQPIATVDGQPIALAPAGSGIVLGNGQTLAPGEATEVGGTPVSVDPAGSLVLGSGAAASIIPLPTEGTDPIATAVGTPISAAPAAVITMDGRPYTAYSGKPLMISGITLSDNGPAETINGQRVSLGPNGIQVGGSYTPFTTQGADSSAVFTVGGKPYTANAGEPIAIGGTTLSPGGPGATINGQPISLGPNGVQVGQSHVPFTTNGAEPRVVFTVDGQTYTAGEDQPVVIDGTTLSPGGPGATINGQPVSLGPDGVQVGQGHVPFTTNGAEPSAVFTVGGQTYTAGEDQPVIIDGTTLSQGGSGATISGQVVSVGSDGIIVGTSTIAFSQGTPNSLEAVLSLGSQLVTAIDSSGHIVIAGTTLSAGGSALTISGETISVAPSDAGLVVDGSTQPFITPAPVPTPGQAIPEVEAPFTLSNGQSLTAWEEAGHPGTIIFPNPTPGAAPITLSVGGPATTIDGQVISAGSTGVVVDGHLDPFSTLAARVEEEAGFTAPDGSIHTAIAEPGHSGIVLLDGSTTLSIGGKGTLVDGESISLGSDGLVLVSQGHTKTVPLSMVTEVSSNGKTAILTGSDYASVGPWTTSGPSAASSSQPAGPVDPTSSLKTASAPSRNTDWRALCKVLISTIPLSIWFVGG